MFVVCLFPCLVFEGPIAAGFADEVLEQVVVHVIEGLGLSDGRQVVDAELEAELLQVLQTQKVRAGKGIKKTKGGDRDP